MIDLQKVLVELHGDVDFLKELLDEFLTQSAMHIDAISKAIGENDAEAVMEVAHTMKGAAYTLHVQKIPELAFQLEKMGREGHLNGATIVLDELQEEMENLKSYVEKRFPPE